MTQDCAKTYALDRVLLSQLPFHFEVVSLPTVTSKILLGTQYLEGSIEHGI